MRITLYVGVFFLVLAAVFVLAARSDYLAARCHWMPVGKTRRRIAIISAIVGLVLIFWQLI
jgi:hypothetical protein